MEINSQLRYNRQIFPIEKYINQIQILDMILKKKNVLYILKYKM